MNIIIPKQDIATALGRESSLVSKGAFTESGSSMYDILYIGEQEFRTLEGAFQDAVSALVTVIREFLASDPTQNEQSVKFSLRKSYPEMEDALKSDIRSYITKKMMAQWLSVVYPAQVKQYEQAAMTALHNLNQKLYYKAPPMR